MVKGKIKWFNEMKRFGFIEREDGKDVFVHSSELSEPVKEGDEVEFEIEESEKGPQAKNVKKV